MHLVNLNMNLLQISIQKSFSLCLLQKFSYCLVVGKYLTFLQLLVVLWKIVLW